MNLVEGLFAPASASRTSLSWHRRFIGLGALRNGVAEAPSTPRACTHLAWGSALSRDRGFSGDGSSFLSVLILPQWSCKLYFLQVEMLVLIDF